MIRTVSGKDQYVAGERHIIFGTERSFVGDQPEGVVFSHGSGDNTLICYQEDIQYDLFAGLARHATVMVADLAFQNWANNTGILRVSQAIDYEEFWYGITVPVTLVGISMGTATALATALAHPTKVKAVAGIIPLTDIADVMTRGAAAEVDAAYGGAYNDVTDGPTHSPVHFAGALNADMPIHLWTAPNDLIVPPATADAFVAARPQTGRTVLPVLPVGHSDASVAAAVPDVIAWVQSLR